MINLPIGKLTAAVLKLAGFGQSVFFADDARADDIKIHGDGIAEMISAADDLANAARQIGLLVTEQIAAVLARALRSIPLVDGVWVINQDLMRKLRSSLLTMNFALKAEAETHVALVLPRNKLNLYEQKEAVFGQEVADKFKGAIYDINEAAKCLALDRSTAAVFHLMHVIERALRAVHACLGLSVPNNPSWGIWLSQIRDERLQRGAKNWPESAFFQDICQHLDSIKDAQRDPTLHVETIHTEEEASLIFENTKAFMKKIALRMDENGDPKA